MEILDSKLYYAKGILNCNKDEKTMDSKTCNYDQWANWNLGK